MYRVEIEDKDGLGDLVVLMARQVGAEYRMRTVLETVDGRLALAIGALTGATIESKLELENSLPFGLQIRNVLGRIDETEEKPGETDPEDLAKLIFGKEPMESNAPVVEIPVVSVSTETPKNGKAAVRTSPGKKTGVCRYCGEEVKPRAVVCEKKGCKRQQSRDWQARYESRKAAGQVGAPVQAESSVEQASAQPESEEAAESEDFLFLTPTAEGLVAKTFTSLQAAIREGTAPDGTKVRARPSGRYFEVRAGKVVPLSEAGEDPAAADPGAAETA